MGYRIPSTDPDILGSQAAMTRAAKLARKRAEATGTPLYVMVNGRVTNINRKMKKGKRRSGAKK